MGAKYSWILIESTFVVRIEARFFLASPNHITYAMQSACSFISWRVSKLKWNSGVAMFSCSCLTSALGFPLLFCPLPISSKCKLWILMILLKSLSVWWNHYDSCMALHQSKSTQSTDAKAAVLTMEEEKGLLKDSTKNSPAEDFKSHVQVLILQNYWGHLTMKTTFLLFWKKQECLCLSRGLGLTDFFHLVLFLKMHPKLFQRKLSNKNHPWFEVWPACICHPWSLSAVT